MRGLDLFSGPGGLTLGMKSAGIIPVAGVEKNKDAAATYRHHSPEVEHTCADIQKLDFKRFQGQIDVVFGGPPCQPFSTGGLRQGTADARNMFPEFARVLREVQPQAFLAENVPGLVTKDRLGYFSTIIQQFEDLGYTVSWEVVSAADYGVPQKRRRLIIVGMKSRSFWFPNPTHGPDAQHPYVTSGSVISKIAPFGDPPDCPVVYAKYPDPRRSPYAGHVYNGGGRPIDLNSPCHTLLASAGGYKTHWVDTLDIAPAYTKHLLDGGSPRDGTVPGARRLTLEESALIQTFPPDMVFSGSRSAQYTQIGDAVPPLLAKSIGVAIRQQLSNQPLTHRDYYQPSTSHPLLELI